jgi:hypothetical protein
MPLGLEPPPGGVNTAQRSMSDTNEALALAVSVTNGIDTQMARAARTKATFIYFLFFDIILIFFIFSPALYQM